MQTSDYLLKCNCEREESGDKESRIKLQTQNCEKKVLILK